MSRYSWPYVRAEETDDDPGGRRSFTVPRRTDFDPEGALEAGRASLGPASLGRASPACRSRRAVPGTMAPATSDPHLWQPLGPMTVIGGQAVGTPRIAGRVTALAVEPTNGLRVYAGSGNGGVWYSPDGGANWQSLGGFAPTLRPEVNRPAQRHACGALFVDFGATSAGDEVFVGTGETAQTPDAQPGHSLGGVGILVANAPADSALANPFTREAKNLLGHGVNRFARQPGGSTIVAATTIGLLQRPDPANPDDDWTRVDGDPFDNLTDECTDVLWTAAAGAAPARLWVWVRTGGKAGLWVRPDGTKNFTSINTAGSASRRTVLAASQPPTQIFVLNDQGNAPAGLYRVAAASAAKPVATQVQGVPNVFGKFGFYCIAMAVHPTTPNRVVLGGSVFSFTAPDTTVLGGDAAIVLGDVGLVGPNLTFGTPNPFTTVGVGAHADVHDLKYSNNGNTLWTGCDGGVYKSNAPTRPVGFVPCNNGLSIIEADYIASHPTCEGFVATCLQDNGVITRSSNGVWQNAGLGDGGGIALDPLQPGRFIREHFRGFWSSSDGTVAAGAMLTRGGVFAQAEFDACAFYSNAASIAHHRTTVAPAAPDVGQIIIGTTRVWYTEDFGTTWFTLPTGTDPLPGNLTQDDFGEKITVCRWQSPDVAWILSQGRLMRYARAPGSDAAAGPGTWTRETIIKKNVKNKKDATSADGPIRDSVVWTDIAVNLDPPPGANQLPAQHGTKGAMYMGTIGKADDNDVDTLWWFDGTSKWFKTGLRTDASGVPAPVTSIVCDPAFPDEVYVGTTIGVWKGTRTQIGNADPAWTWSARVNGLPEAAVEDLTIFSDGGIRLLRAAIASRGAWELRLDTPNVTNTTYVRAHDDDLRYRIRAVGTKRDLVTARSWHGSPDVRPRLAPVAVAAPATLPWTRAFFNFETENLRRFQSALRSHTGDARVRATGNWDDYFNEVLRDLGAPILPSPPAALPGIVSIDAAFWNAQMIAPHNIAEPWGGPTPTEADLYELSAPLTEGDVKRTSCDIPRGSAVKVDVVVHRRGLDPIDGANVRVTLLKWLDPRTKNAAKWNDSSTWFTTNVPWTDAVNEVLNSATGATAKTFGAGWSFVGTTNATRRKTLAGTTLDSTHSGVATFDLSLAGLKANRVVLLVAVIRSGTSAADDIALAAATVEDLAMTSANVAVRSLRVFP